MKIKIISEYPPTQGGIAEHTKHLVNSLRRIGIEPKIIKIKKNTSSNPFYFLNLARGAAKGSSENDIIHIQLQLAMFGKFFWILPGFYITILLVWLKLFTKAKIVVTLHDSPVKAYAIKNGGNKKIFFYYYKFIYMFLRTFVDQFIVHSKNGEKINVEEWKINKERIITIPLGLSTNIMKLNKKECKNKLGYPDKKILLIFGYIRRSKNYGMVLESLKKLNKNVILLIAGTIQLEKDKVAYENILKKVEKSRLKERVKLLGFVSEKEMPLLLNATDVGITLHSQGAGDFLSSTMAMQLAYKIPLLSTNIPSFEILKKEEKCIETFNENDLSDLTEKIKILLYNKSKIRYLKIQTQKYWRKNNWDEIGKKTKKFYLSLLN